MQKSDALAMCALPGGPVDEIEAVVGETRERCVDVGNPVGDVMETGTAPGEEPADRRLGGRGLDQLDSTRTAADENDGDALRRDVLHRGTGGAQQGFKEWL